MSPILGATGGLSARAYGFTSVIGATNSYESISTVTVGSGGSTTISFSSIPATYKHLQIRAIAKASGTNFNPKMQFNGFVIDILDYSNTSKYKTTRELSGQDRNGSGEIALWSGNWRSTLAITSIEFSNGTFDQYSSFALYGIKG